MLLGYSEDANHGPLCASRHSRQRPRPISEIRRQPADTITTRPPNPRNIEKTWTNANSSPDSTGGSSHEQSWNGGLSCPSNCHRPDTEVAGLSPSTHSADFWALFARRTLAAVPVKTPGSLGPTPIATVTCRRQLKAEPRLPPGFARPHYPHQADPPVEAAQT